MSIKNKAVMQEKFKTGTVLFNNFWWLQKTPEMFFNSDEFQKIKNRNRKHK